MLNIYVGYMENKSSVNKYHIYVNLKLEGKTKAQAEKELKENIPDWIWGLIDLGYAESGCGITG